MAAWADDGAETPESVKVFLRRRRRNRGTSPAFIAPIRHIFFSLGRPDRAITRRARRRDSAVVTPRSACQEMFACRSNVLAGNVSAD